MSNISAKSEFKNISKNTLQKLLERPKNITHSNNEFDLAKKQLFQSPPIMELARLINLYIDELMRDKNNLNRVDLISKFQGSCPIESLAIQMAVKEFTDNFINRKNLK